MRETRRVLAFYGWLFAAAGAAFVLAEPLVLAALSAATAFLPGARALPPHGPSLWLGLSGSLLAALSALAFSLSRDPEQPAAWTALLLSKGVSASLFCVFAWRQGNPAFLGAALVDGAILGHLAVLRPPAYEVWFLKLNERRTGSALWLRDTRSRGVRSRWYVWFDAPRKRVVQGRWDEPSGVPLPCPLAGKRLAARGPAAEWDVRWSAGRAPKFSFVPAPLSLLGLSASRYETPVPAALFSGRLGVDGEEFRFEQAPGALGHVWGRAMAPEWRWAHAVLEREGEPPATLELLSARVEAAGARSPWLTSANLWLDGRLRRSTSVWRCWRNRSRRAGDVWSFALDFGDVRAEGECRLAADMTATLGYESPDGRRLECRNTKLGSMTVALTGPRGRRLALSAPGSAAVEFTGPRA